MTGTPFETIATAADVQREWPARAKKAGLTGSVTLQCTPDLAQRRLDQCVGYHFDGAAERPELKAAFEQAAVRVISIIRLKTNPGPNDAPLPPRGFYIIQFNDHPAMPGGPPADPPVTRFPDFLPGPPAKAKTAPAPVRPTPVSYAPAADWAALASPVAPRVIAQPIWLEKPVGADFARFYPAEAQKQNFEGTTTLFCGVDKDGRLTDCVATGIMTFGAPEAIREDFRKATLEL